MNAELKPLSEQEGVLMPAPAEQDGDRMSGPIDLNRRLEADVARLFGGQSPAPFVSAWEDWARHLSLSPLRQVTLLDHAWRANLSLWRACVSGSAPSPSDATDRRFRDPRWRRPPFSFFAQAQLAAEAQWSAAANGVPGVSAIHARRLDFLGRFFLNALAPPNFPLTNPKVVERAFQSGGMNFVAGAALLAQDFVRLSSGQPLQNLGAFRVGETMAITPGAVVLRDPLMELIQYSPTTPQVRREPILITPAWLMKYYIMDLTPPNSLVRSLVDQGFTVFMISWKNPGPELRDASLEDYRRNGVAAALDAINQIAPGERVHAVGYCLGGTLLAIAAAALDRDNERRLASLSLFAAQTDFAQVADLMLFLDQRQLSVLEELMRQRGFLDTSSMASAFFALRAEEMMFARVADRYFLGEEGEPTDLNAWMADPTRMPEGVHRDYLRQLVIGNSFANGRYLADARPAAPADIRTPIFMLGAERDHVAPWRSLSHLGAFGSEDTTFCLTGGSHNSGVVSPPGKRGAYYRLDTGPAIAVFDDPDQWRDAATKVEGSWWPAWVAWLDRRSSADRCAPPASDGASPLGAAPGAYVFEH